MKIFENLILDIKILLDVIKGYKYYSLHSAVDTSSIQVGRAIRIEKRDKHAYDRILPIHKVVGELYIITGVDCIHRLDKWALLKVKKIKRSER